MKLDKGGKGLGNGEGQGRDAKFGRLSDLVGILSGTEALNVSEINVVPWEAYVLSPTSCSPRIK